MSDLQPWGSSGPPLPSQTTTKLYNLRFEHKDKPGRYYYLDRDIFLTRDAKNTKPMSYYAGRIALDHALALAGLMADSGAPNMLAELIEADAPNP